MKKYNLNVQFLLTSAFEENNDWMKLTRHDSKARKSDVYNFTVRWLGFGHPTVFI